ncbi:MAG: ribosome-recycling factor, partial [Chloroflexota bacterium]|nr:ribosome-recycling factor [Chloroflexota bacterium]
RILPTIEKAIQRSDLGLNPSSDGNVLRLAIPPLTEERRKDLVKTVRKRVEEGRIALRNVRREALEELRQSQKEKNISQDEEKKGIEHLQKLTDGFIAETDEVGKKKETDLLEI